MIVLINYFVVFLLIIIIICAVCFHLNTDTHDCILEQCNNFNQSISLIILMNEYQLLLVVVAVTEALWDPDLSIAVEL